MTKDDGYTRITLRIPHELHEKLTTEAAKRSHSMNAEMVQRLEDSCELHASTFAEYDHIKYTIRLLLSYFDFYEDMVNAYIINNPDFTENTNPAEHVILRHLQNSQPNIDRIRSEFSLDARSPGNWVRPKMGIEDQIDAKADQNERIQKKSSADNGSPKKSVFRPAGSEE